jgi:membrane-associated phospholipid phosphatase
MSLLRKIHFTATEKITILYMILSLIVASFTSMPSAKLIGLGLSRCIILAIIVFFAWLDKKNIVKRLDLIRIIFSLALLSFWYPETFEINRFLPNYDHLLAKADQALFGMQPAVLFALIFPQSWLCELMNMGYSSFYLMIVGSVFYYYIKDRNYSARYFFVLMFAFFSYYFFYLIFPASGPQFYFAVIGKLNVYSGVFPAINTYFNTHAFSTPVEENSGMFQKLVELTQRLGERPTAAFPSSHVGISSLLVFAAFKNKRYDLALTLTPFYIFLVMATVYIQAHFLVDVIAGLITGILLFCAGDAIYRKSLNNLRIPVNQS